MLMESSSIQQQIIHNKAASRLNMIRKLRNGQAPHVAEALHRMMVSPMFTYCGTLSLGLPDSRLRKSEA